MSNDVLILHNPRCSTSRTALGICGAGEFGVGVRIRNYITDPLSEGEWEEVLAILEDEPTDLVRRDQNFKSSGLTDADVATAEQVAKVLAHNPALAQRPVLIRADRAIIGRPVERVAPFLA